MSRRIATCPMADKCTEGRPSCLTCTGLKAKPRAPGRSLMECERDTVRVCLRLNSDAHAELVELAERLGCGLARATEIAVQSVLRGAL